jgi:hypothetical protein
MKPRLTEKDYANCAFANQLEVATIKAVAEVESAGSGFGDDDRPKILFEGHWFHKYTDGRYDKDYPTISYPRWTKIHYGKTQLAEWDRYLTARNLDDRSAMMSTSWGKFQIMGFNHGVCGFRSVYEFVSAMMESEGEQLEAFIQYVAARGLIDELQEHRWADFARLYNGPGYAQNQYDIKLTRSSTRERPYGATQRCLPPSPQRNHESPPRCSTPTKTHHALSRLIPSSRHTF